MPHDTKHYRPGEVFADGNDRENDEAPRFRSWQREAFRVFISVLFSAISVSWAARGILADLDKRVSLNTSQIDQIRKDIVPREEHKAHWDATETGLKDIKDDLKEIRRTQMRNSPQQ